MTSTTAPVGVALTVMAVFSGAVLLTAAVAVNSRMPPRDGRVRDVASPNCEEFIFPYVQADCAADATPRATLAASGVAVATERSAVTTRQADTPGPASVPKPVLARADESRSPDRPSPGRGVMPAVPGWAQNPAPAKQQSSAAASPTDPTSPVRHAEPAVARPASDQAAAVDLGLPSEFARAAEPRIATVASAPLPLLEDARKTEQKPPALAPVVATAEAARPDREAGSLPAEAKRAARSAEPARPNRPAKTYAPIVAAQAIEAPAALERPAQPGKRVRIIQIDRQAQSGPAEAKDALSVAEANAAAALAAARPSPDMQTPLSRLASVVNSRIASSTATAAPAKPRSPAAPEVGEHSAFLAATAPAAPFKPVPVGPVQAGSTSVTAVDVVPLVTAPTERAELASLPPLLAAASVAAPAIEAAASSRDPVIVSSISPAPPSTGPILVTIPAEPSRAGDGVPRGVVETTPASSVGQAKAPAPQVVNVASGAPARAAAISVVSRASEGADVPAGQFVTVPAPPARATVAEPTGQATAVAEGRPSSEDLRAREKARQQALRVERLERSRALAALRAAERDRIAQDYRRYREEREARRAERRYSRRANGEWVRPDAPARNWDGRRPYVSSDDPPPSGRAYYVRRSPEVRRPATGILGWLSGNND